jgi:hypothetical protein
MEDFMLEKAMLCAADGGLFWKFPVVLPVFRDVPARANPKEESRFCQAKVR